MNTWSHLQDHYDMTQNWIGTMEGTQSNVTTPKHYYGNAVTWRQLLDHDILGQQWIDIRESTRLEMEDTRAILGCKARAWK
jgi:hypothetical protein